MSPKSDHSRETLTRLLQQGVPRPPREAADRSAQETRRAYLGRAPGLDWAGLDTPIGRIHLAAGPEGLRKIAFEEDEAAFLGSLDPRARLRRAGRHIRPAVEALRAYFERGPQNFDLALDLSETTDFQRKVLEAIRSIPAGRMSSYGQVAERIGVAGGARAVGQALGANPIPIVVPCHRVIASDGSLGGYAGGLATKEFLLRHEGAR